MRSGDDEEGMEYRQHAEQCRLLAQGVQGEQRDQLIEMAATWEKLAKDRADLIRRHPEQALAGEREEE